MGTKKTLAPQRDGAATTKMPGFDAATHRKLLSRLRRLRRDDPQAFQAAIVMISRMVDK